jgi:hypothetical protein
MGAEPQVIVPDGRLEIILHLAEPFYRVDADTAQAQAPALLSGQLTAPLRLRANGTTDIVGIRFRTAAARSVLVLPLAELTDRVEPLTDVAPGLAQSLIAAAARSHVPACAKGGAHRRSLWRDGANARAEGSRARRASA